MRLHRLVPRLSDSTLALALLLFPIFPASASPISWEPWEVEDFDGETLRGELGRLSVPLRRERPDGDRLDLAFVRLPARAGAAGPPIVYLDGGPGSSPLRAARVPATRETFERLRDVGDVILLDQRGVGLSSPGLYCPPPEGPPSLDLFVLGPEARKASLDRVEACGEALASRGIDLGAFHTAASADDVADLARALGAPRISIVGFSYGTHLGLGVLRRHPDLVERAVLVGVEGPDHTRKLPEPLDTHLRKVALLAAEDPDSAALLPDLYGATRRVLERLDREPAQLPVALHGDPLSAPISGNALRLILQIDLGDASDLPFFPALIATVDRGDYRLLAWFVRKRAPMLAGGVAAHYWAVDGASGASPARWHRIRLETEGSTFGPMLQSLLPEAAERLGVEPLPDDFRSPVVSSVPTLFVSGTLDANSPPHQAEEVRWGFSDAEHLVVENVGHEQLLPDPDVLESVVGFLAGDDASLPRIRREPPDFLSIAEALEERGVELPMEIGD